MKCVTSAKAPTSVYRDHLPLLGQHCHQRNEFPNEGAQHNQLQYQQYQQLEIGDRVRNVLAL